MRNSSFFILKSLLNTSDNFKRLSKYLSNFYLEKLSKIGDMPSFSSEFFVTENILDTIHYSWFIPIMENLEKKEDMSFFLFSLSNHAKEKIREKLSIKKKEIPLTTKGHEYLRLIFLSSLLGEEDTLLPKEFLPPSPMNVLAELSRSELIHCIDFLALFDLAIELRKTVETKMLKLIYSYLTTLQKKFLKKIQSYKESFSLSSFLEKWDGSEEVFRKLLHKRGIYRLALALSGSYPDLLWYICHHLDVGRGNTLLKMGEKKVNPVISENIQSRILEILTLVRKTS